jgi:RHS repeat-associated protein
LVLFEQCKKNRKKKILPLPQQTNSTMPVERKIANIEYLPYGEPSEASSRTPLKIIQSSEQTFFERRDYWNTPYKFNAKELDAETGLYYYGARYYTPEVSIWLSVDPLAEEYPSLSPYNYCANNPLKYIDPNGLWIADVDDEGNTTYQKEKGDDINSFQKQYNVSYKEALQIFHNENGATEIPEQISGNSVKDVMGTDILKLRLNNRENSDNHNQDVINQAVFAVKYTRNKGSDHFKTTDFFSGTQNMPTYLVEFPGKIGNTNVVLQIMFKSTEPTFGKIDNYTSIGRYNESNSQFNFEFNRHGGNIAGMVIRFNNKNADYSHINKILNGALFYGGQSMEELTGKGTYLKK